MQRVAIIVRVRNKRTNNTTHSLSRKHFITLVRRGSKFLIGTA